MLGGVTIIVVNVDREGRRRWCQRTCCQIPGGVEGGRQRNHTLINNAIFTTVNNGTMPPRTVTTQRRLQGDATSNNAADDRSRRITIGINHIVIPLKDTVDSDLSLLPNALTAIDEALGNNVTLSSPSTNDCLPTEFDHDDEKYHNQRRICLVHCARGASRSVSVIVAYLLSRHSHAFNTTTGNTECWIR